MNDRRKRGKPTKTGYMSARIVCPFWLGDAKNPTRIRCEGFATGITTELCFRSKAQFEKQHGEYCETYAYKNCPIKKLAEKKYTDTPE